VKVNDPTNTRGGSYDFSFLDIADIERIEVVRGPMSALYGSDALAGVVNIVTRSGAGGSRLAAEVGGHGLRSFKAALGGRVGKAEGYLGLHTTNEDGDIEGSGYEDAGAVGNLVISLTEGTRLEFGLRYLDADSTAFPEDSGGPQFAVLRDVDRMTITEAHAYAAVEHRIAEKSSISLSLSRYDREALFRSPGIAPGVFDGVPPNTTDSDFQRDQILLSFTHDMTDDLALAFGGEWLSEDGRGVGFIDFGFPLPTDFSLNRETRSAFAEGRWQLSPVLLQASLRWDDPDGVDAESSAQVGLVYDLPWRDTQFRATWGQGFKAPSFFALAHPLVGNPNLNSETAESVDVGLRFRLRDDKYRLDVSAFRNEFKDLIDFDPVLFTTVNRSNVTTKGAELTGTFGFESLSLSGHITYLDTDIKDSDARLRGRPRWRYGLVADWRINDKWRLVASSISLDKFWDVSIPTGGLFLDGYNRIDVAVTYSATDSWRFGIAVDNVLDENYQEAIGFPAAGVRGRVNAQYRF
ncbi:MAG: TonB-dependent receptor plug domain-containing protein, partial [Woeseiaceae bacterium]